MGACTRTTFSDFTIPREHVADAFAAVIALNGMNSLKHGGRPTSGPIADGLPHPDRWFAGMTWDYHRTCGDLVAVFTQLGFHSAINERGDFRLGNYAGKSGDEDVFLVAVAPFATHGSTVEFRSEFGDVYGFVVDTGLLYELAEPTAMTQAAS